MMTILHLRNFKKKIRIKKSKINRLRLKSKIPNHKIIKSINTGSEIKVYYKSKI